MQTNRERVLLCDYAHPADDVKKAILAAFGGDEEKTALRQATRKCVRFSKHSFRVWYYLHFLYYCIVVLLVLLVPFVFVFVSSLYCIIIVSLLYCVVIVLLLYSIIICVICVFCIFFHHWTQLQRYSTGQFLSRDRERFFSYFLFIFRVQWSQMQEIWCWTGCFRPMWNWTGRW